MDPEQIDVIIRKRGVVTNSRNVAEIFNKRHDNVLQRIENIHKDWKKLQSELSLEVRAVSELSLEVSPVNAPNAELSPAKPLQFRNCFIRNDYLSEDGRLVKSYDMTRQGFSILTLGFNGKRALAYKIAYTSRFEAMERELTVRNTYHEMEKGMRKILTDAIQAHYEGDHLGRKIQQFTDLLYIATVGNKASKFKQLHGLAPHESAYADGFTSEERATYAAKETFLLGLINSGVMDYHELKARLIPTNVEVA